MMAALPACPTRTVESHSQCLKTARTDQGTLIQRKAIGATVAAVAGNLCAPTGFGTGVQQSMLWLILAAGAAGCLLGLWLMRAPLIAPISLALAVVCVGAAPYGQWGVWTTASVIVAAISTLQLGYFAGLSASVLSLPPKAANTILASSHNDHRMM